MVGPEDAAASLGPWVPSELKQTAHTQSGIGADDGLPAAVRFVSNVAKLIRRRHAQPDAEDDPLRPAIFLLRPTPPEECSSSAPKRVPMLDNGLTTVCGRVWFVGAVAASGRYVEYEATDDDEMFRLVTDILNLGGTPAIVFDPRTAIAQARFYPNGLDDPDLYECIALEESSVTLDRIFDEIERVYRSCLVTPEAQSEAGKLWHDQDKWRPSRRAEAIIQLYLRVGLVTAFPTCTVRPEQVISEGRLDLEIEQSAPLDPSNVTRHAVLELKVLRTCGEGGTQMSENDTLEWIEKGVNQAYAYRIGKDVRASALCCFDMRKEDTGEVCFEHILELAEKLSVKLKRWFIYAKSEYYRDALAAGI